MVRHRTESDSGDLELAGTFVNSNVTPVTFFNKDGRRLFGMLHRPTEVAEQRTAIILLSPGVKMRVAPHRLYNHMAERFAGLGYPVLRFDFYGLGDSEGEVCEKLLADLYGAIQVGRYIGDTVAAMDWLEQEVGISSFILSGLCGGAITGLLAGAQDSRVVALLGLAIPVILDGSHIDHKKYITDGQLIGARNHAIKTALKPGARHAWARFFTFQSNYRLILRSILKPLLDRIRPKRLDSQTPSQAAISDNTNPNFAPSFFRFLSASKKMCLVFAEMDRHKHEFESKFVERHRAALEVLREGYEIHVVKSSNHIFSFFEWEEEMLVRCCEWLQRLRCESLGRGGNW